VIIAPIVEETFFRGFLFAGFRQRYGYNKAALLSSAIFAAAHLQPSVLVPTFVLGYIFSYLYQRSNSILPGMILHFLVNAFGIITIFALTRAGVPIIPR
jgi:membrane protease YdiL (CAAX protease family)